MFIGHYGPAFAAAAAPRPPALGPALIAVQLVDYAWATFILLGIERARLVEGITALSPLDLHFMPYTHSLPAALAWSLAAALVYAALDRKAGLSAAGLIGACVFSHWILDFLVHRPDLPLWGDSHKVGLGLWNYPTAGIALELLVLAFGMALYIRATAPRNLWGRIAPWALGGVLGLMAAFNWLGPPPADVRQVAVMALVAYTVVAALGFATDRGRLTRAFAVAR